MAKTISCVLFVILRLLCLAAAGLEKEEDNKLRQPVYANSAGHRPRYYVIRPSNNLLEAPLAKKFKGKPEVLVQEDDAAPATTSGPRTVLPPTPEPPKARHAGKYPVPSRASIKIMIATSAMLVAVAIVALAAYLLIRRWKLDLPKDERVAPVIEQPVVVYQYQ